MEFMPPSNVTVDLAPGRLDPTVRTVDLKTILFVLINCNIPEAIPLQKRLVPESCMAGEAHVDDAG
jgi:hypothetical protein